MPPEARLALAVIRPVRRFLQAPLHSASTHVLFFARASHRMHFITMPRFGSSLSPLPATQRVGGSGANSATGAYPTLAAARHFSRPASVDVQAAGQCSSAALLARAQVRRTRPAAEDRMEVSPSFIYANPRLPSRRTCDQPSAESFGTDLQAPCRLSSRQSLNSTPVLPAPLASSGGHGEVVCESVVELYRRGHVLHQSSSYGKVAVGLAAQQK